MNILPLFFVLLLAFALPKEELNFSIKAKTTLAQGNPVSVDISSFSLAVNDHAYRLFRVEKGTTINLPYQISAGSNPRLHFILDTSIKAGEQQTYILKESTSSEESTPIKLQKTHNGLMLTFNEKSILNYQFEDAYPPEGIDPIYHKSGFIHPLWSPAGEVLTRIQPPDHYHHYGIWGPWTKTHIKGRPVDFWNLSEGQGTVRFSKFISETEGPVFSGFSVLQEHLDFGAKGADQIALNETLTVAAYQTDPSGKTWMVDYTTTINCPLDSGILFDAYRYGGGIGMRATEKWHKDNCTVLTSEGNDRLTADGTEARWCIIEGESTAGRSGVLFMGHPQNKAFPEPMRVWPLDANKGRGDLFFEFCPIRHEDWNIKSRQNYTLKYRMIIFDGKLTAEGAESYWQAFAHSPELITHK